MQPRTGKQVLPFQQSLDFQRNLGLEDEARDSQGHELHQGSPGSVSKGLVLESRVSLLPHLHPEPVKHASDICTGRCASSFLFSHSC